MKSNRTKGKLRAGELVVGCFVRYPSATLAEFVSLLGWDFVVFDSEHGEIRSSCLPDLARACEASDVTPITRLATGHAHEILRALDSGCQGIQVPGLSTYDEVALAISACLYPPDGHRGLAPARSSGWALKEDLSDVIRLANQEILTIVHVENLDAADGLCEWLTIEDLDVVFIGSTDLSASLGHPGASSHPRVAQVIDRITREVLASGKAVGVYASTIDAAVEWAERGARYIATGIESLLKGNSIDFVSSLKSKAS